MDIYKKEGEMAELVRLTLTTSLTMVTPLTEVELNDHADEHSFTVSSGGDEYEIAVRIRQD